MKIYFQTNNHSYSKMPHRRMPSEICSAKNTINTNQNLYFDAIKNYNIAFIGKKPKPVYSIDSKGKYTRYNSYAEAAKELSSMGLTLSKRSIGRCTSGEISTTGGLTFIDADILEIRDENNNPILDKDGNIKIKNDMLKECLKKFKNTAIYSIDKEGNWKRFDTQAEAARKLNVGKDGICDCVNGKLATSGGYSFVWAKYIETTDENGNPVPDENILNAFALDLSLINKEVYCFDKDGNHEKFDSPTIAANFKEMSYDNVSRCLTGEQKTSKGLTFILAQDIETINKDKTISLKQEKIDEILNRFKSKFEVYAVDKNGKCLKFDNMKILSKELGIPRKSVWLCSQGAYSTTHGYVIVKAEEIESTNKNGETIIDKTKLNEILKIFKNKAVYAIHRSGKKDRYNSQKEAADATETKPSRVSACVRGARNTAGDYTYIAATELERGFDKNGEPIINIQRLKDVMKRFKNNAVYHIDKYGNCTRYETRQEAAKATNTDASDISRYMDGARELSRGKAFVMADIIEIYDEDGNMSLNQDVIKKAVERIWKRALYIINPDGYYEKVDGIWEAAMDKKGIYYDARWNRYMCRNGYNMVHANKVETLEKDGNKYKFKVNHRKLAWIREKCQEDSIYLYDANKQICKKYSGKGQVILMTGAYTLDKDTQTYKLKDGFKIFSANDIDYRTKNGYYIPSEEKMRRKLKEFTAA